MSDLKPTCKNYFFDWSDKKLDKLEELFDDEIRIRDWNGTAIGKEQALAFNKIIFDAVKTCTALPLYMYQDGLTVACRLNVYINKDNAFEVLDLITFNEQGKIVEILAFRGN
jgi:hypothetical protein